jgi:hypothetical protein
LDMSWRLTEWLACPYFTLAYEPNSERGKLE